MGKQSFVFDTEPGIGGTDKVKPLVSEMAERLEAPKPKSPIDSYKLVPRYKIRENKKNKYPKHSIDSLKESILSYGIQQDITAVYVMDEDMYVLETGHRRTAALDALIEEFRDYSGDKQDERYLLYNKNVKKYELAYLCKITGKIAENTDYDLIDENDLSKASDTVLDSEIRLQITNIEARNDDSSVRAANISRLSKLYTEKNKRNPKNQQINVNKKIAEDLNITDRQVKYYKTLDHLIPELKEEFEKNSISIKDGSNYAKLSPAEQNIILSLIKENAATSDISKGQVELLLKEKSALTKMCTEKEMELHMLLEEKAAASATMQADKDEEKEKQGEADIQVESEKDMQIESLREEIAILKNRKPEKIDTKMGELVKSELQFKASIGECEKAIIRMLDLLNNYKLLYDESSNIPRSMITKEQCNQELEKIKKLLLRV